MRSKFRGNRSDEDRTELAVLGVGNIGSVHVRSALAMPTVDVIAAADVDPENRAWAEEAGVPETYEDVETLFASTEPDVAVVALPPFLHLEAVEQAAAAGVDVFVEKPLARSVEEVDSLLETASDGGIAVGVDHTLRYQPDIAAVKAAYDDGSLGHVPFATMTRLNDGALGRPPIEQPPPGWQLDPEASGGGALFELGVHCFDVLEWILGPLSVRDVHLDGTVAAPAADATTVVLRSNERETTVVCHAGTYQWEHLPAVNTRLRLEGIADTATNTEHVPDNFYVAAARSALSNVLARVRGRPPTVFGPTHYLRAHYLALEDFIEARRMGEDPPVDGADGRRAVSLVEAALERAERHPTTPPTPGVTS